MHNIYDYILNYKEPIQDEITTLDALIFSRLSYIHFENILDKLPLTINNLLPYLEDIKTNQKDYKLVTLLSNNPRFKDLKITRCQNILDKEKEEQFLAITIKLPKALFLSFRGTNKNIIGFKEDMNMCYGEIPSQIDAKEYVNSEKTEDSIYLGGHSKGGNLAMYAGIHANAIKKQLIKKIYNFDGPGFLEIKSNFKRMKDKITNYFPECSIVGRLMQNEAEIIPVKTTKEGIEAHNLYYWEIENNSLLEGSLKEISNNFYQATQEILLSIPKDRRKIIVDYMYKLILEGKIKNLKEIDLTSIKEMINHAPRLLKEEKNALFKYLKCLIKSSMPKIVKKESK